MKSDISVVIPMYNSEKTIEMVLESVVKQTLFDRIKEIIIIDDGSTDLSKNVVEKFIINNNLKNVLLISQKNGGVSRARNRGLIEAKGEYIALLDSDDIWLESKLEKQMEIFDKNPEVYFLGCGHLDKPLKIGFKRIKGLYKAKLFDIFWKYFPVTPSVIFKQCCIEKIGMFDEKQRYCEDINYYLRFAVHYGYYYLPDKLVTIDIGKDFHGQTGLTSNIKGMHQGEMKNLYELYKQHNISLLFYMFFYMFLNVKYLRRIIRRKMHANSK